jgi:hypothetical protein
MCSVVTLAAQDSPPKRQPLDPQTEAAALAKFDALPVLRQVMVVRRIEQALADTPDPGLRRIAAQAIDEATLPAQAPSAHFDPDEWTGGVAPARHVIPPADSRHRSVYAAMPPVAVLQDLARRVAYDWSRGTLVRCAPAPGWRERFASYLRGYPPHADAAYARALAALDRDPEQRRLAVYFEHTYADRDGGVFAGVSLYQAWYAGDTIEMPDVDAIAFAVSILGDRSYHSPIPADARRDRLYAKIRAGALSHRKYRTMLEAAAAAVIRSDPEMDEMYARLAPRFHYLWKLCDDDADRLHRKLQDLGTRDALIEFVDGRVVRDPQAMDMREGRGEELAAMAARVTGLALSALAEEKAAHGSNGPTPSSASDKEAAATESPRPGNGHRGD